MSEEERPELGKVFKRFTRKAIEKGIKLPQRAVEEGVRTTRKIVEKAPIKPPISSKKGGVSKARPFTASTTGRHAGAKRAYWNPLEGREYPILEYDKPLNIELENIAGLSRPAEEVEKALKEGERRILLVGPQALGSPS